MGRAPQRGNRGGAGHFWQGHGFFLCFQVENINEIKQVSVVPYSLKVVDLEFSGPMSRPENLPMPLSRLWSRYDDGFVNFNDIDIKSTRYD